MPADLPVVESPPSLQTRPTKPHSPQKTEAVVVEGTPAVAMAAATTEAEGAKPRLPAPGNSR